MNPFAKILLVAGGTWVVSVFFSFVAVVVTAGVTSKWGAVRLSPVLMALLAAIVLIFVCGVIFVHWMGRRFLAGQGSPWLTTLLYSGISLVTVVTLGFVTLVLFNR